MFRRKVTAPTVEVEARPPLVPAAARLGRVDTGDLTFPTRRRRRPIFGAILLAVFAVIAAVFLALLLFNVVVLAIELMILILGLFIGLFSRVVLRKPWTVFASPARRDERHVVGWRAAARDRRARGRARVRPAPARAERPAMTG